MRFAAKLSTDFLTVADAFMAELGKHFADADIAELGMMIGQYIALGRLLVISGGHQLACEIYVPEY